MKVVNIAIFAAFAFALFTGCKKYPDMSLAEIDDLLKNSENDLIARTLTKPYNGEEFTAGETGGVWHSTILSDPKTFNQLIAERDADSNNIISMTSDFLVDYDMTRAKWLPHAADFIIISSVTADTLTVRYTLRDDLYWSYYNSDKLIPVTSDDYVFWYNEIAGDEQFASSGYAQQQVTMKDGTTRHIDCVKITDKIFEFIFPRIVADPLLATNMNCCPSFIYKSAKEKGGAEGVKALFASNIDPATIPSCGKWYISEYIPGLRLTATRNPYYWEKDKAGVSIPYPKKQVFSIVGDVNTDYLLFKQGKTESFSPSPENLSDVVKGANNDNSISFNKTLDTAKKDSDTINNSQVQKGNSGKSNDGYSVFNAQGSLSAQFISFNQNPKNADKPYYKWFTKKEFRQAISCLINRQRLIDQSFRGLASPKYDFFPEPNQYYNKNISLQYKFSPDKALELFSTCGYRRDDSGVMRDEEGNRIEFNLTVASSSPVTFDMALIIADECKKVGVTINIRQTDFQKMIEMLTATYDWEAVILAFGASVFPSQGSNVWPSYGNLHLWNPLQKKPATAWEERVDYLYNEGCYTHDEDDARGIWDEYQKILLEECPLIYLVRPRSFYAIRNRWDLRNFYYDNKNGAKTDWVFLRQ